jgi:uncharacterized protein
LNGEGGNAFEVNEIAGSWRIFPGPDTAAGRRPEMASAAIKRSLDTAGTKGPRRASGALSACKRRRVVYLEKVSNKEIVQEMYQAFLDGEIGKLLSHCAPTCEWIIPGSSAVPTAGRYVGKQEIGHFFARVAETMRFDHFETRQFIAEGDQVAVLGVSTTRFPGSMETATHEWTMVFTFSEGKVIRFQEFYDTARVEKAFQKAPGVMTSEG